MFMGYRAVLVVVVVVEDVFVCLFTFHWRVNISSRHQKFGGKSITVYHLAQRQQHQPVLPSRPLFSLIFQHNRISL